MAHDIKKRSASHIYYGVHMVTGEIMHISQVPSGQKCNCVYNVAMARVIPLYETELISKEFLFLFYQSSLYQSVIHANSRSAQAGFNKQTFQGCQTDSFLCCTSCGPSALLVNER